MHARPFALGCMRLSTEPGAAAESARLDVLRAALASGATWFDTADVYAPSAEDLGHNERLLAAAGVTATAGVTVVSKAGLVRQGERWTPDGRAAHLKAAATAATAALGRRPELFLLHAVDRKVKLATSVRALLELAERGAVGGVGVSNVGRAQLEEALALAPPGVLRAVEVELHPWELNAVRGGVLSLCEERDVWLLAHRPLGGVARKELRRKHPQLTALAAAVGCSAEELILAWLHGLSPKVVPLPGATTVAHVESAARAARMQLPSGVLEEVNKAVGLWKGRPWGMATAAGTGAGSATGAEPGTASSTGTGAADEVVIVMGIPASGKTTRARHYEALGYERLNRDERGGTLTTLAKALQRRLGEGARRIVLDNTYARRADRGLVIELASRYGLPVRCEHVAVSIEQAQRQAVQRMLEAQDRLLEPDELASKGGKTDPSTIPPRALFTWQRDFEPPALDEGFAALAELPPARRQEAGGAPALLLELDELLWRGKPQRPDEVVFVDGAAEQLGRWRAAGWQLAGTLWRPAPPASPLLAALEALLTERLGVPFPFAVCRHPAGPPLCWCRKPLPGMALLLARRHRFSLAASLHLGRGPADKGFALRAGCAYLDASAGLAELALPPPSPPSPSGFAT